MLHWEKGCQRPMLSDDWTGSHWGQSPHPNGGSLIGTKLLKGCGRVKSGSSLTCNADRNKLAFLETAYPIFGISLFGGSLAV